jgi:hypothetical protein
MSLKINYLNINGLDPKKLDYIEKDLTAGSTDIFIIAEHWFSDFRRLEESEFFVVSSRRPDRRRLIGHENGGIAILSRINIQNLIYLKEISEFVIQFVINKTHIAAVYFPPRLHTDEINSITMHLNDAAVVLGDINVRFGKHSHDKNSWNIERGKIITRNLLKSNLQMILASNECSRNDHVFSKIPLSWKYTWLEKKQFSTDHGMMEMLINALALHPETHSPKRFALSLLQEPILFKNLADDFQLLHNYRLQEIVAKIEFKLLQQKSSDVTLIQSMVDTIFSLLYKSITNVCGKHLPEYHVDEIKTTIDKSLDKLHQNQSYLQTIKTFKRSQRLHQKQNKIQPRDKSKSAIEEAFVHYQNIYNSTEQNHPDLSEYDFSAPIKTEVFSPPSISKCIQKYSSTKACGPDGIHIKILKCLNTNPSFSNLLSQIFRFFYRANTTPQEWNTSLIHLLIKDTKEPYADKTRPISLTNVMRRIYEKCLYNTWTDQPWAQIHNFQAGFRRGYSTYSHIMLADNLARRPNQILIFLDLKNAFDKVSHTQIIEILKARKCPTRDLNVISSLMTRNCNSILTCNHLKYPQKITRRCGLFQGSILSPFLFNIFIDPLATRLNKICPSLFFADDILIIAKSLAEATQCMNTVDTWQKETNMQVQPLKSGSIGSKTALKIGQSEIPMVPEYKYLGVPMRLRGVNWLKLVEQLDSKSKRYMNAILPHSFGWSAITKLIIYRTFIRPILEYTMPLYTRWAKRQDNETQQLVFRALKSNHEESLKWIFDKKKALTVLESLSGLGTYELRIRQLEASLAHHFEKLSQENPLSTLLGSFQLSSSPNDFLSFCKTSEIITAFRAQKEVKFKTFMKKLKLQELLDKPGKLHRYISNACRSPSGTDSCLMQENATIFIQWRTNTCFLNMTCQTCEKVFTRRHINTCFQFPPIKRRKDNSQMLDMPNYTILDEMLNMKKYEAFMTAYSQIKIALSRKHCPSK